MIRRRTFLKQMAAVSALATLGMPRVSAASPLERTIPSSGVALPAIGMGTWLTFNVGDDPQALATRTEIVRTFLDAGGTLIDSSPMYGRAEAVIGHSLDALDAHAEVFSATKVWTPGAQLGVFQMNNSLDEWGLPAVDLMQVHNLLDWTSHLPTLREWKAEGRIRHIGITTSHGRRHDELERIMRTEALDFVQLTYNLRDREAEPRLLPLAADLGLAVIVNRPFRGGLLFREVTGRPLPGFAAELGCTNWAQVFLKFIVSHPAVTCAIPATSQVAHMVQNMGALEGPLPDETLRSAMVALFR